jgi:hypothetical protein
MSDLIVIGYPDEHRAHDVWAELVKLGYDYLVDLEDAAMTVPEKLPVASANWPAPPVTCKLSCCVPLNKQLCRLIEEPGRHVRGKGSPAGSRTTGRPGRHSGHSDNASPVRRLCLKRAVGAGQVA